VRRTWTVDLVPENSSIRKSGKRRKQLAKVSKYRITMRVAHGDIPWSHQGEILAHGASGVGVNI
jgi:hypothetical protein